MLHAGYERAPLPPVRQESPSAARDASAEPPAKVRKQPAEQRDPFLDNAKYLTIVLVAIGHVWDPLRDDSRAASALYFVLYAFHMPAFIIISGYLSRSFEGKPRQIKRLITGVLVPYVVFQTVYTFFMRWASDNPDREFHYQEPGFALWFLVALFLWRLTTPLWKSMRWPVPVALAIAVAAGVTPSISNDLNLMRVAAFLPFFVLGLQLKPEHFQIVTRRRFRMLALPVFAAAVLFAYWAVPRMSKGWFLHDKASQDLGAPAWVGGVMTLATFGCGLVLTAAFLALVPRRHMWFTALGAGTLYAYLLHVYPIKISREFEWYDMEWVDHPLSRVGITLLAAVMMTVLCTSPFRRVFRFVMEPKMEWFFKQDAGAQARARENGNGKSTGAAPQHATPAAPDPGRSTNGEGTRGAGGLPSEEYAASSSYSYSGYSSSGASSSGPAYRSSGRDDRGRHSR
ncbi:Fucose 4-O-acetylase [Streptomyces sp. WMMB 714]|uniref:acyltransferase family protein n=1 Tax=Streptomyces sp. WMMB 714 TaxID=1286822 RepID=UPI000823A521|nr:acyltransferase family protein [Streptomyces sp. WMMB 714]SCK20261.1 Fucose 4-O-acetylase [Streptomyces sp. WMMB 714]